MTDIRARSCLACSDMHLSDAEPALTDAFLDWLARHTLAAETKPDVVLILGDAFDAWIGDDSLDHLSETSCGHRLAKTLQSISGAGIRVMLMHGNRDFLIGEVFAKRCGATLLGDTARLHIDGGKSIAMTHGDLLCTQDTAYLAFRATVRNPEWQSIFLAKSVQERIELARQLREKSKTETAQKAEDIVDVTISECEAMTSALHAQALLHGHTHRPGLTLMPNGMPRWVLPDWSLDKASGKLSRGGGLLIDQQGVTSI